jgi:hypothetical protein
LTLAINQPYFFPYLGYFALIENVDEFILFDTPQFIRHGWIERNQILKPTGDPLYIKVPLIKHKRETPIIEIQIRNSENWKEKILAQLVPYKKRAPFYFNVVKLLNEIFSFDTDSIAELNYHSLTKVCDYIGIKTPIKIWSKLNVQIGEVKSADEWALQICKALKADTYINPKDGVSFFNVTKYRKENIDIKFLDFEIEEYTQFDNKFTPCMSIIDVMMFNDKEEIRNMLSNFKYL